MGIEVTDKTGEVVLATGDLREGSASSCCARRLVGALITEVLAALLLATVVSPPFLLAVADTSSMAAGAVVVASSYLALYLGVGAPLWRRRTAGARPYLFPLVFGALYVHGAVCFLTYGAFDGERFSQSLLLLVCYSGGAFACARLALAVAPRRVPAVVRRVFAVLVVCGVAGVAGVSPFFSGNRPVLLFAEPSHFALTFLPFLLCLTVLAGNRGKLALVGGGFALALLLQNLTLLVGVVLIALLATPKRHLLLLLPAVSLSLAAIGYDYYVERLDFSSGSRNLSTLVYLQGWERAILNVRESYGGGVGFQQFGVVGSAGTYSAMLEKLGSGGLNQMDGGSVAAKTIGEFGAFGVAAIGWYLAHWRRTFRWLRRASFEGGKDRDPREVFFRSVFFMYVIDIFVRGTGYFSSSGFLVMASLGWFALQRPCALAGESRTRRHYLFLRLLRG